MTGSCAALGGDRVTFCIYGYEDVGCSVEWGEGVSGSSKGEKLSFKLG